MKKVLVIDDVEGVRKSIQAGLRGSGYEVSTAGTYAEGLGLATSGSFDVILCDLKLPDKSGVEIIKELKDSGVTAPVVAISGFIDGGIVRDALNAGAVAYLPKPFSKGDLVALLAGVIPPGGK
jgi:CheY-like chemotaxis protein